MSEAFAIKSVFNNHLILENIFKYLNESDYLSFAFVNQSILGTICSNEKLKVFCEKAAKSSFCEIWKSETSSETISDIIDLFHEVRDNLRVFD